MADAVNIVNLSLACFHGCVKGLVVLSQAKHCSQDMSDVRLQIEIVQHSLFAWADETGLTQEPPALLIPPKKATLVPAILERLETLLSDLRYLKEQYGLRLQPTAEEIENLDEDSFLSKREPSQRAQVNRAVVSVFGRRKQPWRKLRWVTFDDKKVALLLDRVRLYTRELEKVLEHANQARWQKSMETYLRDVILNTQDQQDLGILGHEQDHSPSKVAIGAAARLKQLRLKLGISNSSFDHATASPASRAEYAKRKKTPQCVPASHHNSSHSSDFMRLPIRLLRLSRTARASGTIRTLAQYDNKTVLLEWKRAKSLDSYLIKKRVNQLATFLHSFEPSLHSLPCRGFVEDHTNQRYGYIFDVPRAVLSSELPPTLSVQNNCAMHVTPDLTSLRQLMDQTISTPSLNQRLLVALTMLETILNLHTSGWLHKELRSDNIALLRVGEPTVNPQQRGLSTYSIYIAGYVSSRVDGPGEMTEIPESELEADLYRHPSLLCNRREAFRKSFDLFGVGCTLLEIGLWSSFRQILEKHAYPIRQTGRSRLVSSSTTSSNSSTSTSMSSTSSTSTSPLTSSSMSAVLSPMLSRSSTLLGQAGENIDDDVIDEDPQPPFDLLSLRYELLLSSLTNDTDRVCDFSKPSPVMQSLEAATGRLYASVVKECLLAGDMTKRGSGNEHEYALDLEIRARDTVQNMMDAV